MKDVERAGAPATSQETRTTMLIAMILLSVGLASIAQLTLKSGMNQVTEANGGALALSGSSLRLIASNVTVWIGLVLFGLSAVAWLFVLSRTSLSFAYPFAALTYLVIVLVDLFWFKEEVPPLRWLGVGLIMAGIVLVARTAPDA
jgi:drug/metabolite transporter (DMT)-like permease